MNDQDFHREQLSLFFTFNERLQAFAAAPGGELLQDLAGQFAQLAAQPETLLDEAPAQVARMLTTAPQLAEHFPRDLLWYLGGECLHYMPDDEIDRLSNLDEARRDADARGETFNWREMRAHALRLQ